MDVRGSKTDGGDPTGVAARSVVLMSARELEQHHQAEASAWQKSTAGIVASIDAGAQKLTVTSRTPEGPKPLTVDASGAQFTRYSPETPKTPKQSAFTDIQTGDQVKVIGEKAAMEPLSRLKRSIPGPLSLSQEHWSLLRRTERVLSSRIWPRSNRSPLRSAVMLPFVRFHR